MTTGPSRQNQSVRKAVALLRAAAMQPRGASVSALARAAGLPRATALRMIESLIAERLLARIPGDRIVVGAELYRLARATDVTELVVDAASGVLEHLVAQTHEAATLSVVLPDGTPALVKQVDGPYLLGMSNWVGRPVPLHASSSGRVVLAHSRPDRIEAALRLPLPALTARTVTDPAVMRAELAQIRMQGWSIVEDELEVGVTSMSAAIVVDGALFGCVSLSGPTVRLGADRRRHILPVLQAAAATIVTRLSATVGA